MRRGEAELLAPAGSFDSLRAAVGAGADGVYIGGSRFGARAYADNLDQDRMLEAIDYAHIHGVSLYMTVNTLMKEQELEELYSFLLPYYERGLDGVIVQDLGAVSYIRRHFPSLPIHGSTQMTVTGVHGARILTQLGITRVVTAREMSLEEIRRIHEEVPIEIESFVHGELCYCYSGQCLLSSLIGGRSGNRGRCAQPCRLPYRGNRGEKDNYILSMKDLCTLDLLPEILEAGVCSLKIEGRMKSPRYTAGVVRIYRKYMDLCLREGRENYRVDPADIKELLDLFDRGGFTAGYYKQHNGPDMIVQKEKPGFRQANQPLFDELDRLYVNRDKKEPIEGKLTVREGEETVLRLGLAGERKGPEPVAVKGEAAETAQNRPMAKEQLEKQMRKIGDTAFYWKSLDISVEGQVFLPVKALNGLRREGIRCLEEAILQPYRRRDAEKNLSGLCGEREQGCDQEEIRGLSVLLSSEDSLSEVLGVEEVREVMLEADGIEPKMWKEAVRRCHKAGKHCVLAMPVIFQSRSEDFFDRQVSRISEAGFDGILVRSLEEIGYLKEKRISIPIYGDHNLYLFNSLSGEVLSRLGCVRTTFPLELNGKELKGLRGKGRELVGYGLLPAMVSAQCVVKTLKSCTHSQQWTGLTDRTGKILWVRNHCTYCYNVIYNPDPLSLLDQKEQIKRVAPELVRLVFTRESKREIGEITRTWADALFHGGNGENQQKGFTRGHFRRGVE